MKAYLTLISMILILSTSTYSNENTEAMFMVNISAKNDMGTHEVEACILDKGIQQCDSLGEFTREEMKDKAFNQELKKYGAGAAVTVAGLAAGGLAFGTGFLLIGPLYGKSALAFYGTYGTISTVGAAGGATGASMIDAINPMTYHKNQKLLESIEAQMSENGGKVQMYQHEVEQLAELLKEEEEASQNLSTELQ